MNARIVVAAVLGIVGSASVATAQVAPTATAVYRYSTSQKFFYDTSPVAPAGMTADGNVFYTFPANTLDTVPFRRFFSATAGYVYTTADEELIGFTDDCGGCTIGNIATKQLDGTVPLFRLRHPTTRNYFYTISTDERDDMLAADWRSEGTSGFVYDTERTLQIGPTAAYAQTSYYQRADKVLDRAAGVTLEALLSVDAEASKTDCTTSTTNCQYVDYAGGEPGREGAQLSLITSDKRGAILQIGTERILAGTTKIPNTVSGVTFDIKKEHVYRIVIPAGGTTFKLYIDNVLKGSSYKLLAGAAYAPHPNRVVFGDGTTAGSSQTRWRHVRYANTPADAGTNPAWDVDYRVDLGLPSANGWTETSASSPPSPTLQWTKPAAAAATVSQSPVYRSVNGNYAYTTSATPDTGYTLEGNFFTLLPAGPNTVPLHRYKRDTMNGYYLGTTSPVDAQNSGGILANWTHEGSLGWISEVNRTGLVPLYRFLLPSGGGKGTHYYTTEPANVLGVTFDRIVGYVIDVPGDTEPSP